MYSVICICHNHVCYICEYSSEATVFQVETFQKHINRFRKYNSSSKKIVGNLNNYLHQSLKRFGLNIKETKALAFCSRYTALDRASVLQVC